MKEYIAKVKELNREISSIVTEKEKLKKKIKSKIRILFKDLPFKDLKYYEIHSKCFDIFKNIKEIFDEDFLFFQEEGHLMIFVFENITVFFNTLNEDISISFNF